MTRGGRREGHGTDHPVLLPQRRRPRVASSTQPAPPTDRVSVRDAAAAGGACAGWVVAADTGRRVAGQRRSRPARGFGSRPPLAACSLAVLAFLGDRAASFQVRRGGGCPACCAWQRNLGCCGRLPGARRVCTASLSLLLATW